MTTVLNNITAAAEWYVGEDKSLTFTVRDSNEAVVNVTGWTMKFVIRLTQYNPTELLTKTTGAGIALTTPVSGVVTVDIDSVDTAAMRAGTYWYGLARTNAGAFDVVSSGSAVLLKSAAQP